MANLYLVDVENICANPLPTQTEMLNARLLLMHLTSGNAETDYFVLASHAGGTEAVRNYWPNRDANGRNNRHRLHPQIGTSQKDGADRALEHWVNQNLDSLEQWETVVLASGDHYFIPMVKQLQTLGKKVKLVCLTPFSRSSKWGSLCQGETYFFSNVNSIFGEDLAKYHPHQVEFFLMNGRFPKPKEILRIYEQNRATDD